LVDLGEKCSQRRYRLAWWRCPRGQKGRGEPPLSNRLGQLRVCKFGAAGSSRWAQLRHNSITVGHEHDLALRRQAYVFAQPVLQNL